MSSVDESDRQYAMQTDFQYRDESSGFERDIHKQSSGEGQPVGSHWLRTSQHGPVNIDDVPIPTGGEVKTFEQLLEEKLEAQAALGSGTADSKSNEA